LPYNLLLIQDEMKITFMNRTVFASNVLW